MLGDDGRRPDRGRDPDDDYLLVLRDSHPILSPRESVDRLEAGQ